MKNKNPDFNAGAVALVQLLRTTPIKAGNIAVNHFLDSFKNEAWEGEAWDARKPNPFDKNSSRRALLVKTSTLKRSIKRVDAGTGYVKVGTNIPYAQVHNEGGTIIQKPTFKQRLFFSHASDAFYANKQMEDGRKFAAMSTAKKLVIKIPKRQFMGNSETLNRKIETLLFNDFENIIEKAIFIK